MEESTSSPETNKQVRLSAAKKAHADEVADSELPQSAKESAEAYIKLVKLQLIKDQMQSLKLSKEESEHFYLQQKTQ